MAPTGTASTADDVVEAEGEGNGEGEGRAPAPRGEKRWCRTAVGVRACAAGKVSFDARNAHLSSLRLTSSCTTELYAEAARQRGCTSARESIALLESAAIEDEAGRSRAK